MHPKGNISFILKCFNSDVRTLLFKILYIDEKVFVASVCVFSNGLSSLVCLRMIRLLQLLCLAGVLLQCEGQLTGLQACLTSPTYRPAGQ